MKIFGLKKEEREKILKKTVPFGAS